MLNPISLKVSFMGSTLPPHALCRVHKSSPLHCNSKTSVLYLKMSGEWEWFHPFYKFLRDVHWGGSEACAYSKLLRSSVIAMCSQLKWWLTARRLCSFSLSVQCNTNVSSCASLLKSILDEYMNINVKKTPWLLWYLLTFHLYWHIFMIFVWLTIHSFIFNNNSIHGQKKTNECF